VEDTILLELRQMSWVSVKIRGTLAVIEVVEKTQKPPMLHPDYPCDIVASKDGVIFQVLALKGKALVKAGDPVARGHVLISGRLDYGIGDGGAQAIPARGIALAKVWYQEYHEVPVVSTVTRSTKNRYVRVILRLGQRSITLTGRGEVPFPLYEVMSSSWTGPWRNIELPVELVTITYEELIQVERHFSPQAAKAVAMEEALRGLIQQVPPDAERVAIWGEAFFTGSSHVGVQVTAECLEHIAEYRAIEGK